MNRPVTVVSLLGVVVLLALGVNSWAKDHPRKHGGKTLTVIEHATTDAVTDTGATGDSAGDLLTFGRGGRVTHIGIYVGHGRYVHASPTAGRVIETSLERTGSPLVKIWRGGRRLLAERDWLSDSTAAEP